MERGPPPVTGETARCRLGGGITYHTTRATSHNLNESLGCNWRLLFAVCRFCWRSVPGGRATSLQGSAIRYAYQPRTPYQDTLRRSPEKPQGGAPHRMTSPDKQATSLCVLYKGESDGALRLVRFFYHHSP